MPVFHSEGMFKHRAAVKKERKIRVVVSCILKEGEGVALLQEFSTILCCVWVDWV